MVYSCHGGPCGRHGCVRVACACGCGSGGAGSETEAKRHSQAKDNKVCVGVAGRGVRVCVCVRARVRVGMHVVCGHACGVWAEAERHIQAKDNAVCVCVCAYVCGVGRVSVCWGGRARQCVALWHAQVVVRGWCVWPCECVGVGGKTPITGHLWGKSGGILEEQSKACCSVVGLS